MTITKACYLRLSMLLSYQQDRVCVFCFELEGGRRVFGVGEFCAQYVYCIVSYSILLTKYVHIKSTIVYAPRRNWDSPQPPSRRLVCSLPPVSGGRGTLAGEKGVGRVPIPTRGIHCGTLYMYVLCDSTVHKSDLKFE
jgi:hypothetical protein